MRLALVVCLFLASCSLLKSNSTRCFDIVEKFGTVKVKYRENSVMRFECGDIK